MIHQIDEKAKSVENPFGHQLKIKNNIPPALSDPECAFIETLQLVHKKIFGKSLQLRGSGPANEGYQLIQRGVPTVSWLRDLEALALTGKMNTQN